MLVSGDGGEVLTRGVPRGVPRSVPRGVPRGLLRGVLLNRDLMVSPKLRIVLPVTGLDADLGDTLVPDLIPDFGLVSLSLLINRSIYINATLLLWNIQFFH